MTEFVLMCYWAEDPDGSRGWENKALQPCPGTPSPPPMLGMGDRAPYPSWKTRRKSQRVAHACTSAAVCIEGCNPWRSLGDAQPQTKSKGDSPQEGFLPHWQKFKRSNHLARQARVRSAWVEVPKGLPTPATAAANMPAPLHAFLRPARLARIKSEWQATLGGREEEQIIEMKCQVNKPNARKTGWKKWFNYQGLTAQQLCRIFAAKAMRKWYFRTFFASIFYCGSVQRW